MKTLVSLGIALSCLSFNAFSFQKAVIGFDERTHSNNPKEGRISTVSGSGGCSGSLIGKSCMVTAGHCKDALEIVEFNPPPSSKHWGVQHATSRDIYKIDKKSIVLRYESTGGEDWAVFRIKKHKKLGYFASRKVKKSKDLKGKETYLRKSGYYPGEIQGHYQISYNSIKPFQFIRITGYGSDENPALNRTQRTALGFIYEVTTPFEPNIFIHDIDASKGNSGSGVVLEESKEIIGVHTFSSCTKGSKIHCRNGGTAISLTPKFEKAIRDCLDWENQNITE